MNQIPEITVQVLEYGDNTIACGSWRSDEGDAFGCHRVIVAPKIVGGQKECHAAACLVADELLLIGVGRTGEEKCGAAGSGRRDQDPAFVLLRLIGVFDEREAERLRKESDRFVVVPNNERDMNN